MRKVDNKRQLKNAESSLTLTQNGELWCGRFLAMASPCELLLETTDKKLAEALTYHAAQEAWRIEQKFSCYRDNNIVAKINNSNGQAVTVDEETTRLLDFAYQCYELSDGLFDISSGILRAAWAFDHNNSLPKQKQIAALLPKIGLDKATWINNQLTLKPGMEIDLGGIGKEYAVDRVLQQFLSRAQIPTLVNFGGDIAATARHNQAAWRIGIEANQQLNHSSEMIRFTQGGIATSGDARRHILYQGKRYGHILNPKTGWPVADTPHSVTVIGDSCTEAGLLSTLAMLQGAQAEQFLKQEASQYWVQKG